MENKKIALVVSNERVIRELFAEVIKNMGWTAYTVAGATELMNSLDFPHVDLVVISISHFKFFMSAEAATKQYKETHPKVKIILVSEGPPTDLTKFDILLKSPTEVIDIDAAIKKLFP